MIYKKTFRNMARRTASVAAAVALTAVAALTHTACTSELDTPPATTQEPDGITRLAPPTLGAFPANAYTVEATPGMGARAVTTVPGGGTQQNNKITWEKGDSVLVGYKFTTYYEGYTRNYTARYTEIYVTYTVTEATGGIPTLAPKGDAKMLEYKVSSNLDGDTYSENKLDTLKETDMVAGIPVPMKIVNGTNGTYKAEAYYAPGQEWKLMKNGVFTDTETVEDGARYNYGPCCTDAAAIAGKYYWTSAKAITSDNNTEIPVTASPTFKSWSINGSRLRVHALPGDAVTLSGDFYPTGGSYIKLSDTDSPVSSLTATADADGNAWFYGMWSSGATLSVQLNSKELTGGELMTVFEKKMDSDAAGAESYAIDAVAGYGVFCAKAAELFTTTDKTTLTDEAKSRTTWYVTDAGELAASNDIKTALGLAYNANNATRIDLVMPNVTTIANGESSNRAFFQCTALRSVSLPKAETIGDLAFYGCTSLTTADMSAATTIRSSAFQGCSALTTVKVQAAKTIGLLAFASCTSLTSVKLPEATEIVSNTFDHCSALTTVDAQVAKTIGGNAFYGCTALKSVNLPVATEIGGGAFYGCTSLTSVELKKAETIGSQAFYGCTALKSVNLPVATKIGRATFYDCTTLETLTFGADITYWGDNVLNKAGLSEQTTNIALTLSRNQKMSIDGTGGDSSAATFTTDLYSESDDYKAQNPKFAGYEFKSITLK